MCLKPLKIGYFADGIWAHNAFHKIAADKDFEIAFIVPRFDSTDSILQGLAKAHKIPFLRTKNINSPEFIAQISRFKCDIFVSMSFNQIFKEPLISLPRLKSINCHAGKLPFYRGRNVLNWALINDEHEFGITTHYIDSGIDTGDIITQKCYPIGDEDDYTSLLATAHKECANVLYEALCALREGKAKPIKQESIDKIGFYCPVRGKGDEFIDWSWDSRRVFNFIRALNAPNLGAKSWVKCKNEKKIIRIFKAKMIANAPKYIATAGVVVGDGVVKTNDSTIALLEYDFERSLKIGDRMINAL